MNIDATRTVTAALEHLTGTPRGTVTWLSGVALDVSLSDNRRIRIAESAGGQPGADVVARLHRSEETYEIEAFEEQPLWVNRERVNPERLENAPSETRRRRSYAAS